MLTGVCVTAARSARLFELGGAHGRRLEAEAPRSNYEYGENDDERSAECASKRGCECTTPQGEKCACDEPCVCDEKSVKTSVKRRTVTATSVRVLTALRMEGVACQPRMEGVIRKPCMEGVARR